MGNLQEKGKEMFYLITLTLLTLLLPLSFLLIAKLWELQTLTWYQYHSPQHLPYLLTLALHINPLILHALVSIVSMASLIHSLTGKVIILSDSAGWGAGFEPRLYTAWILLCTFQVCVGLGIEGSIEAGLYDSEGSSFGAERSMLSMSTVVFLLGLHETTQVWARMVVRPVVDDTVYGVAREERWVERVGVAASLGALWCWRLREDVQSLIIMVELDPKKDHSMDIIITHFVSFFLYYLTVSIGIVRIVKSLMSIATISLSTTRTTISTLEYSHNDDKV
ncbi:hypothetical protein VNO78_18137 [Psophocarpus tetragonolobus]|uniref:Uncharacterized protein n=1 Tax=Psophocarpus tetragonolobus TaxID=3891 RepID=A0AAN9XLS4_PSOTE